MTVINLKSSREREIRGEKRVEGANMIEVILPFCYSFFFTELNFPNHQQPKNSVLKKYFSKINELNKPNENRKKNS